MRKSLIICLTFVFALSCFGISDALAGAKIKVSDDTEINLGWRLQVLAKFSEDNLKGPGSSLDSRSQVQVRRARFRLGANIGEYVSTFLQTDISSFDVRMIDAFVKFKIHPWFQVIAGQNMAPISRQNLTSSGALLAIDRPGQTYKSLTWGTRTVQQFASSGGAYTNSNSGIGTASSGAAVRDTNVVLFGSGPVGDDAGSLKYYVAAGDGINASGEDSVRFTIRGQYNFWDPEPGYYNLATYLGKKKTLGIGAGYDTQADVATGASGLIDYTFYTFDLFLDYPLGDGTLTFEGAWQNLDLDKFAQNAEGDGFYLQAGYLFAEVWQPWVEYEVWSSDAANDNGSYDLFRFGISYFIKGHNANIKAGYEIFNSDTPIVTSNGVTTDDSMGTFILGAFVTY